MLLCYIFQCGIIFFFIALHSFQVVQVEFLLDVFAVRNAVVFVRLLFYLWPVIACIACLTHGTCLFIEETTQCHYDTKVNHKCFFQDQFP